MADDRYNWLDKDTAERLLRGEPVSARNGHGAEELAQLLEAAAAVTARAPETVELPGEEAAVAAFHRAAHGAGAGSAAADPVVTGGHTAHAADRAERTRLARPIRRGLAVALAACAIGGVAVAAGTGVLPDPFRGGDPAPASSVSADETPGPFRTGEPGAQTDGTTAQTPDATPGGRDTASPGEKPTPGSSPGAGTTPGSTPGGGTGRDHSTPGGGTLPGQGGQKNLLLALCRNYESGKRDAMDRDTLRRLESKAGGPDKVHVFCRAYLARYQNLGGSGGGGFVGGAGDTGGSGQSSGGSGGDEDDEGHPSPSSSTTPGPGVSVPAPAPSATAPDPGKATPTGTTGG
ncbi:hypothetical protein ACFW81_26030 [Streptomyces angustmyceticus]|uniref:hypothetical protein n=1 Tax=Streptomyces angustmyceticus TaxID=285578 RepID=UPI003694D9B3